MTQSEEFVMFEADRKIRCVLRACLNVALKSAYLTA